MLTKVALFGYFGMGNFGNDASLEAMLLAVRKSLPEARVECISYDPSIVQQRYGIPGVRIDTATDRAWGAGSSGLRWLIYRILHRLRIPSQFSSWCRTILYLRDFDAMIVAGTGILDDFGTSPRGLPYDVFKWCLGARLAGTKVLFVSVGAGPINHPVSRRLLKWAASLGSYRSYRDEYSRNFMRSIGLDTRLDPVYPDLVFSLPVSRFVPELPRQSGTITVGIGVMAYLGWGDHPEQAERIYKTYAGQVVQLIVRLLEEGYAIRLLTGDVHDQEMWDDVLKAIQLKNHGQLPPQFTAEAVRSIDDVFRQISTTDLVVATRFHNVVCGLMLNKPVISMSYAEKNNAVLAMMGLSDYVNHAEHLDVDRLLAQINHAVKHRDRYTPQLESRNRVLRQDLEQQFSLILGCSGQMQVASSAGRE